MTSFKPIEIRWIDRDKGYGLFATNDIPATTEIFRENCVLADIRGLGASFGLWDTIRTQDGVLPEAIKERLKEETQRIVTGMRGLKNLAANEEFYKSATDAFFGNTEENQRWTREFHQPQLEMDLYRQVISQGLPETPADLEATLQEPLDLINKFLEGFHTIHELRIWGPYSSAINHACKPTASVFHLNSTEHLGTTEPASQVMTINAFRDIKADEEITILYRPVSGDYLERREQLVNCGFCRCQCVDCVYEECLHQLEEQKEAEKKEQAKQKRKEKLKRQKERKKQTAAQPKQQQLEEEERAEASSSTTEAASVATQPEFEPESGPKLPTEPESKLESKPEPESEQIAEEVAEEIAEEVEAVETPDPPHRRLVRSSSFPEPAVIERWLKNAPLPLPSQFTDIDCHSEDGREIRFGFSIRERANQDHRSDTEDGWELVDRESKKNKNRRKKWRGFKSRKHKL